MNINVPIRNRQAQSAQARSELEYRQAQMRLQQLYVQTRMQVVNAQYALTNDRASVQSALATRDYDRQSVDAELKKLHLGASTTALVLQQQRALATAESSCHLGNGQVRHRPRLALADSCQHARSLQHFDH